MAIGTSKISDLGSLYNLIYNDSLVTLYEENVMVANGMVMTMQATGYAARKIGSWATATVQTKPEGDDYAAPVVFSKSLTATLTPAVAFAQFLLTDEMVQTDSVDDVVSRARTDLGAAMADYVDDQLISDFASFSGSIGSAGGTLTYGHVGAAIAQLRNAKIRGNTSVVLHPYQWHQIWKELGRPAATYDFLGEAATEALRRYFVSNLLGATWVTSANVSVDSSDDAVGGVFTQEALGYDERESFNIEPERDASKRAIEYNASLGFAHGVVRSTAGVKLTGDASTPTS